jgi:hypothetical protein
MQRISATTSGRTLRVLLLWLAVASACERSPNLPGRPPRRMPPAASLSSLELSLAEGTKVTTAVAYLRDKGFNCQFRNLPWVNCCQGPYRESAAYICNRRDGRSIAQVILTLRSDRVERITYAGSLAMRNNPR